MPSKRRYELLDRALGRGLLPDPLLRIGSRLGARARLREGARGGVDAQERRVAQLVEIMSTGPIAELTDAANDQHYELPPDFFATFLGPHLKYSCCLWGSDSTTLAQAEEAMLRLTCERAGLADGQEILELGCGWGSLSLWIAEHYPGARLLAISNSNGQREWITAQAEERGLKNIEVRTCDVNDFDPGRRFDRVVSVEMFEHMRNWRELLQRISGWLEPDGRLFVHVFSQREHPYRFEGTWAAERFFSGGLMPSHELIQRFQSDLVVERAWAIPGTHYARTLRAWLERFDANHDALRATLARASGANPRRVEELLAGWRLFLISTDEIWKLHGGNEWLVSHYALTPRAG